MFFQNWDDVRTFPQFFPPEIASPEPMLIMPEKKNNNTYKNVVWEKDAHRDLTGFAPSFVHRAPLWTRFVKKLFRTILYYSVLFPTIPL
jgi:hypothetical protein